MSHGWAKTCELMRRLARFFARRRAAPARHARDFYAACRELAFWAAADAGLDGEVDSFDGSLVDRAADGLCIVRMIVRDRNAEREAAGAAACIINALAGLRVLLLLEIDGMRFASMPPNVNAGVGDFAQAFTNDRRRAP